MRTLSCINVMLQQHKENREIRKLSKERMTEHHKYLVNKGENADSSNMKLKYILNAILFVLALSFLSMCIFKTTELSLKCMQFAVSISCIGAMFSTKSNRCIFASIALIIIGISFLL
ncbi:hypothetical protein [uncultured Duncaniella sp.]|uniref:hypothetical protein n=1 Tax=uncultured Duncaniella sp. TaxID=2768039 RepID=UPI00265985E3|nr:hypothetical protein [uncultured Duncaniella sp.]